MRPLHSKVLALASLVLAIAVMLGAFGAHGLEGKLSLKQMSTFNTGITYHFYHGFALFLLGIILKILPELKLKSVILCFCLGILFFSGNCYIYAITGIKTFALIIPIGGLLFIKGWLTFAYIFFKESK